MGVTASWLEIGASVSAAMPVKYRARAIAPGIEYAAIIPNEIRVALAQDVLNTDDSGLYFSFPGLAGSYFDTPSAPKNKITGDMTFVALVAPDVWATGNPQTILGKRSSTNNFTCYNFRVGDGGEIEVQHALSGNGTLGNSLGDQSGTPLPSLGAVNGQPMWIKADMVTDDHQGNSSVTFWKSTNGLVWTAAGQQIARGMTGPGFDADIPLELGTHNLGTLFPFKGKIFYAAIHNGVNGPLVVQARPRQFAGTGFQSATGETWTQHGTASVAHT